MNSADSSSMAAVKNALQKYLTVRNSVFEKNKLGERDIIALYFDDGVKEATKQRFEDVGIKVKNTGYNPADDVKKPYELIEYDRDRLGQAYDAAYEAVNSYLLGRQSLFKYGRGKARLKQVESLKERLKLDNMRFWLSSSRRNLLNSYDFKYDVQKSEDGDFENMRKAAFPTWLRMVRLNDMNTKGDMARAILEKRQREQGKLPGIGERMALSLIRGMKKGGNYIGMGWSFAGGLIDRGLGLATMLAANTLELAGKVIKAPLKLMSGAFNKLSAAFGQKKRWRMDYSLTSGWKSIDDGRRIFRRYLKGACILPAAVIESVTRGIPYIFGHHFKSGVYKRTSRWSKDIFDDVKNVFGSISGKKYDIQDRAYEEMKMAGGYFQDKDGSLEFYRVDEKSDQAEEEEDKEHDYVIKQLDENIRRRKDRKNKFKKTEEDVKNELASGEISTKLAEEFKKIDKQYGKGVPKKDILDIKQTAAIIEKISDQTVGNALSEEMQNEASSFKGVDSRTHAVLMRPVNLNKEGKPLTKDDETNLWLNELDHNGYRSGKVSDRKPHLDFVAKEAMGLMFTSKQLKDEKYIRSHRAKAIRALSFFHGLINTYTRHEKYYLTQADPEIRIFMYLVAGSGTYIERLNKAVSGALMSEGFTYSMFPGSSSLGFVFVNYRDGREYKVIKKYNKQMCKLPSQVGQEAIGLYGELEEQEEQYDINDYDNLEQLLDKVDKTIKKSDISSAQSYRCRDLFEKNDGKVDAAKLDEESVRSLDEYDKNIDKQAYKDRMLKEIDDYVKTSGKVGFAPGIIDDLS